MGPIKDLFKGFGTFTYTDRNDTLHYVLKSDLRDAPHSVVASLGVGDQHVFHAWWYALNRRVQPGHVSIPEAMGAFGDLVTLINTYKRACFDPVFERPSNDFLAALNPQSAVELESARERLNAYLARVEEVGERLSKQTTCDGSERFYIDRPKPLRVRPAAG